MKRPWSRNRSRQGEARFEGIAPLLPAGSTMSQGEYDDWREERAWAPPPDGPVALKVDVSPAAWLRPLLRPDSFDVAMTVPAGFESYARIFLPFSPADGGQPEYVSWSALARRNGKIAHALMEEETVTDDPDGEPGDYQVEAQLTAAQFEALVAVLAGHTASTTGWFLLWDGFGDLNPRVFADAAQVHHPMRDYYLFRGPLGAYDQFPDPPSYWWPEDGAWCYSTDTDFAWAYIAGSAACVGDVVADPLLDAFETRPDNPARFGMDVINRGD